MNENTELTIKLYKALKESTQEERDEWRRESLEACPKSANFIETVYKCVCD